MTPTEAHRRAIEAACDAYRKTCWNGEVWSGDGVPPMEAAITAYLAAMVLPIPQHPGGTLPDVFIAFYENGHVTPCEFLECSVGGPDDHETFHPMISPRDEKGKLFSDLEAPWPTHWTFLPEPPK